MARFVTSFQDPAERRAAALGCSEPENARCANCAQAGPRHVCLPFRTFVCELCKHAHEEFGHKTIAVADPEWDDEDVDLVAMEGGNKRAAAEWLAFWRDADFPRPTRLDERRRRDFIRKAYVVKCWQRQPEKKQTARADLDESGNVVKQQEKGQAADSEPISSQAPAPQPAAQAATCSAQSHDGQEAAAEADAADNGSSTPTTAGGDLQGDVSGSSSDGEQPRAGARPGSWLSESPATRTLGLPALPPPAEGEAWTADFELPARGTVRSAAAAPAPRAAGPDTAGAAPGTPAAPASPSDPATPKLGHGDDPAGGEPGLLGSVGFAASLQMVPQVPTTPRTKPYQPPCCHDAGKPQHLAALSSEREAAIRAAGANPQGAAPAWRLPGEPKTPTDRFAALDDVDEWEQEAPSVEFAELLEAFNEKAASWEQKGKGAAPGQGVGRVPAAAAASPGSGFDSLLAAAGFSWL